MSERMTDEQFEQFFCLRRLTEFEQGGVRNEALRARASEVEKDAQIKALADALERWTGHMVDGEWVAPADVMTALRLVGRL